MEVQSLLEILDTDFYTGVPDSQLKALCNYLMDTYGIDKRHHLIAANEGNATALAAGYYLATRKPAVVYMQNSGEGNAVNPIASLLNDKVYAIPAIFIIGWRGEPGIHDEPQHIYQGEITLKLLEDMGIPYLVIDRETGIEALRETMLSFKGELNKGKAVAFVIKKGALSYAGKVEYRNNYTMAREAVIEHIAAAAGEDPVVSTTGKASRELFEIREKNHQRHQYDFLTVGSMGHSSSIALGVAINKPDLKVWCIDGDGALLMHMGAMAVIGNTNPDNFVHIVINNEAHETVGGMPTTAGSINIPAMAKACGYHHAVSVDDFEELDDALQEAKKSRGLCMIEVKCAMGSRKDLGRPTTTTFENKDAFMSFLSE